MKAFTRTKSGSTSLARRIRRGAVVSSVVALAGVGVAANSGFAARAPQSKSAPGESAFNALVAQAEASNHKVAVEFSAYTATEISTLESDFQADFGFPLSLTVLPGSPSTVATKVITQAPSHTGPADMLTNSATTLASVLGAGLVTEPNWSALQYKWPIIKTLRADVGIKYPVGTSGVNDGNYCVLTDQSPDGIMYNTNLVDPAQLKGATLLSLDSSKWAHKVAVLNSGTTISEWTIEMPGFTLSDAENYAHQMVSNGAILVSGSSGSSTAIQDGQAALGEVGVGLALKAEAAGAPVGFKFVPFSSTDNRIVTNPDVSCLPLYGDGGSTAMAELFMGWYVAKGVPAIPRIYGTFRFDQQESKIFPWAVQLLKKAGFNQSDFTSIDTAGKIAEDDQRGLTIAQILTGS